MSIPVQHPECDLRSWLQEHSGIASAYTVKRITESYPRIEHLLGDIHNLSYNTALDMGCGSGFDSFAMAVYFDHVVAIDTDKKAIEEAVRIAREAGVANVHFDCANVEQYETSRLFNFAFCNLMSHNVGSRCLLAVRMAMALEERGWLNYAEEQEGYAPLEIHRATERQDLAGLSERLRQLLRGFTGTRGFRFFASGTMQPLLAALGLRSVSGHIDRWNGLPFGERMSCVRDGSPSETEPDGTDPDYLAVPGEFREIRERFGGWISVRPPEGFTRQQREEVEKEIDATANRYGPFLTLLLMADLVLPSLNPQETPEVREPDWDAALDLDRRFIAQVRKSAGLEEGPIDD